MGGRGPYREDPGKKPAEVALKKLQTLSPDVGPLTPEYIWAGRVAMTVSHYPQLHVLDKGVFAGLGFNGRGVAMGTMMGKCLADLARGKDSLWPVTTPQPFKMHAFGRLGIAAYSSLYAWLDKREEPRH